MSFNPILILSGELNSIFLEIFFKARKLSKIRSPSFLFPLENILKNK